MERTLGMDVADEVNVRRQMRQDALAPIGAVAGKEDLIVRIPLSHQVDELASQFRASAMIRIGFGTFTPALLPLGEPLPIAVQTHGDRQGEHLGGCPKRVHDDQAKHDPVVSPTDQRLAQLEISGS